MSSNNNHKPAEIDEGNNELQRTYDSTMVGRDGLKSYWDRIFAHVKDELPSIDSDLSSSGSEDGEVAIFQRGTMGLISHVPDDLGDLSLDDPVLEEMLESARWPREAWAQDYKGRASEQDFQGENSRHLEKSTTTNKCNNIENIMLGQPATPITGESENSLGLEAESRPSKNKYLADLRNSGGGEPQSSIIPKAIDNKEREILRCQGSGDRNLDYRCISTKATGGLSELTTENDLMQNISQKTPELVLNKTIVTERHLVNSSQDQETTQIPKEGLKRRKSTRTVRHGHRPPILSLECVEQIDLDGLLKTLQQVGKSSSDFEDIMNGMWPASVPSHIKNEQNLMEQLTSLSIKQSGGVISLNNQTPICNGEHQSNSATQNKLDGDRANNLKQFLSPEANTRTKWMGEKLTMKRASEPKTIFIDLRNWQQERSTLQTDGKGNKEKLTYLQIERSLESSFEEDNQNSLSAQDSDQEQKEPESDSDYNDCTGKSMLLKKLRKASVNFSKVTANNSKSAAEQARATGEQIKPAQKKRRKAKNESNKPVGEQHGLTVAAESKTEIRALEELNSPNDQPALTPGLTLKKTTSKVTIPAVRQSELTLPPGEQYPETLSSNPCCRLQPNDQMQREYCRKEQQRRQRLHRQLDSMKPLKSVTGMQCGADETPLLFHPEASYLPNISTLLQKGRSDMLLLTVQLSSCGQLTTSGQQAGHLLDSMMTTVNLYNALVSWFLSLVPTQLLAVNRLHGDCGDIEVKAPFQVLGVQQAWQEDGLALYVCVVPVSQVLNASKITYSKSRKNKPKEELRGTSIFYQLVMKFLSQTCLKAVIWWSKQMNDSLQRQMFPPEIYLPTVRLNSLISVKPDFKAVKKIFEIEMGFYWQTIETDESSCPSVTDIDESCGEKPEVTMALLFENLLINPVALHHTLQLILGNGLDICGLRLLYPSYRLLAESAGKLPSVYTPDDADPRPVLALALRGMNAGSLWMDIVGPTDPQLASVTDQHSINALYCKHRDEPLLYTPHQKIRIYWELCVWFGGRVPENGIVRVGIQNPGTKNSLKYRSNSLQSTGIHIDPRETCRPPTTLVATIRADIFLLVSPAVPPRCYGDIISVCTRRGFSLRGIRRLRLSPKRAGSLGIASVQIPVFCQTALTPHDSSDGPPTSELLCPCFLLLLRKENASHHVVNLLKGLANELAEQGLLGRIRNRLPPDTEVQTELCFHVAPYNEQTLQCLGGPLSAVHRSASLTPEVLYKHSFVSNPELEQVVVLTLTGPTAMKNAGNCLRDLLRPPSNNSNNSSDPEARPLLKYLSPSLRSGITKPDKETQTINTESIFSYMLLGVQPLLTVLVIKSSTWPQHFLKILRKLDREHFCVVGMKLVSLDTEKASLLTPLSIQQDPGLVKCSIDSLTSGASVVLCLRRDNAVKKLLDLLGPEDPQQARDLDQFLWRGHYGTDRVHNGLYGSSSFITAIRDVKIFFPEGLCCEESQMMQDQQIACNTKDWRINPEFPKKRKLVRSLALTHLDSGTPTWQQQQQDLLLPRPLCQTMCLLLPSPLIRRCHHPPYIEVLDQLQSCNYQLMGARMSVLDQTQAQHVAELITVDNTSTICSLLTSGPCLMLALERDNGVCCFSTILTSLSWEKLELEDCLQYFVYPKSEPQVEQLISCLFDSLVPQSIHQIVLQDS
ncbi:dynein axonemal assembly factor 8 isoform X5 [Chiloscyllium plagiosum]|uniref:dynein axonemal assembly factor 8 isoform X5 n=1 Tax=Chiloscyllium plagiosum TaxID=36176 RepID=UPI001CB846B2|nr:dynein axonemal assembly factor 8 isoform X5 [Chiloscyllium plagiosum]